MKVFSLLCTHVYSSAFFVIGPAALGELYCPDEEDGEWEAEYVIYEQQDGEYSAETSLADAWELWKIKKVITDETMCWAEVITLL